MPRDSCAKVLPLPGGYLRTAKRAIGVPSWGVLGNDPLTIGGEDYFVDLARWATKDARKPREIREALEEFLWLVAWNDETGEDAGRSRVWRDLMRDVLAEP